MFNRAFDPAFSERMLNVSRLWHQYLEEKRMEEWLKIGPLSDMDTRRLLRIAIAENKLVGHA